MKSRSVVLIYLLLGAVTSTTSAARAVQPSKTTVEVTFSGSDTVGQRLAYSLREEISRSARYSLGSPNASMFTLHVVSVDLALDGQPSGLSSATAVAYTMRNFLSFSGNNPQTWLPIYLTTTVHTVGRDRAESVAKAILAVLDEQVQNVLAPYK
jgi:hypothetical protein